MERQPVSAIEDNLQRVYERIRESAQRAGRDARDIKLVAVSKTVDLLRIREAIEAGVQMLGENYVQEAQKKIEEIGRPVPGTSLVISSRTRPKSQSVFST